MSNSTGSKPDSLPSRPRWTFVLLLYPFLLYGLLTSGHPVGIWLGHFSLGALILSPGLLKGSPWAWLLLAGVGLVAYWAVAGDHQALSYFLPQILVSLFLMVVFGRTLRPGRVPLITRIAIAIHDGDSDVPMRYTRGVTILWVVVFALLVSEGLVLAWMSPDIPLRQVSLASYALVTFFVLAEYAYHNWRYPSPAHRGLPDFLRHLARIDYRRLIRD